MLCPPVCVPSRCEPPDPISSRGCTHALAPRPPSGTLQRLPRIVHSDAWVREVCLTGRRFGAAEALRQGCVGEVVAGGQGALLARALDLARVIAGKSPVAVCGIK